jgi:hypothetical protein
MPPLLHFPSLAIDRTYAVGALMGGLEGQWSSKNLSFPHQSAAPPPIDAENG